MIGELLKENWEGLKNYRESLKKGDKIVWMIIILLLIISIIVMFSSTSLLASNSRSPLSRVDIFKDQLVIVIIGAFFIGLCYLIPSVKIFRGLSQLGWVISVGLLSMLSAGFKIGDILKAEEINGAVRTLGLFGMQIHVYEVVKVAMVMYMAWAIHTLKEDKFRLINYLTKKYKKLSFLSSETWKIWLYIFLPLLSVVGLILRGGGSSAIFIGGILFITTIFGKFKIKYYLQFIALGIVALAFAVFINVVSGGEKFVRFNTIWSRTSTNNMEIVENEPINSKAFNDAVDKLRQPEGAKIAIKEGSIIGKLPGNSTQKYEVPLIYNDYVYSFIIEEYGLLGAFGILWIFGSLLARGILIVTNSPGLFEKAAVGGLVILISGQALFHMIINADFGILTGQTLPMISHGASSFICFSIALGVILSLSKLTSDKIDEYKEQLGPISQSDEDNPDALHDIAQFEENKEDLKLEEGEIYE